MTRPGQGKVRNEARDGRLGSKGRDVRWNGDTDAFEMRCLGCREFLPVTLEFWRTRSIARCLACWRERSRLSVARLRSDPAVYAEHLARYRAERRARRAA